MGPTWVVSAPDGPHVGPMNLAIREHLCPGFLHFKQRCLDYCTPFLVRHFWAMENTCQGGGLRSLSTTRLSHNDVIKWKLFPRYWPFVRRIHRSPVNSPHIGQWRGALMFSLICVWINGWINNREAGDLRRYRAHYDVTVMLIVDIHILLFGAIYRLSYIIWSIHSVITTYKFKYHIKSN